MVLEKFACILFDHFKALKISREIFRIAQNWGRENVFFWILLFSVAYQRPHQYYIESVSIWFDTNTQKQNTSELYGSVRHWIWVNDSCCHAFSRKDFGSCQPSEFTNTFGECWIFKRKTIYLNRASWFKIFRWKFVPTKSGYTFQKSKCFFIDSIPVCREYICDRILIGGEFHNRSLCDCKSLWYEILIHMKR